MVRMVHMNIFYKTDLQICDLKSEFSTTTENQGFQTNEKNQYWGSTLTETKMVRMVHMNIFYEMDLQISDPKSEF